MVPCFRDWAACFGSGGGGGTSPGTGSGGGAPPAPNPSYSPPVNSAPSPNTTYGGQPPIWQPSAQMDNQGRNKLYDQSGQNQGAFTREEAARIGGRLAASTVAGHQYPEMDIYEFVYGTANPTASFARGDAIQAQLAQQGVATAQNYVQNQQAQMAPYVAPAPAPTAPKPMTLLERLVRAAGPIGGVAGGMANTATAMAGPLPWTPDYNTMARSMSAFAYNAQREAERNKDYGAMMRAMAAKENWATQAATIAPQIYQGPDTRGIATWIQNSPDDWLVQMRRSNYFGQDPRFVEWVQQNARGYTPPSYGGGGGFAIIPEAAPEQAPPPRYVPGPNTTPWNAGGAVTTRDYSWPGSSPTYTQPDYSTSVSGKIFWPGMTSDPISLPGGYLQPKYDPNVSISPDGWVEDPNIRYFDGNTGNPIQIPDGWGGTQYNPYTDPSSPYNVAPMPWTIPTQYSYFE